MSFQFTNAELGPLSAFCSSLTWAIGSTGYARLSRRYSGFAINFLRAMIALPLFILVVFLTAGGVAAGYDQYRSVHLSHVGWLALGMYSSYGLGDVMFMWSTRSLGVSGALAIASSYPLWIALVGVVFQNQQLLVSQWVGLFFSILGIGGVILSSPREIQRGPADRSSLVRGLFLAFFTSILWALHGYAVNHAGKELTLAVGNSVRMLVAMPLCYVSSKIFEPHLKLSLPLQGLKNSLWIFVIEAFGGSCFFMYGMSHSPLAIGSTLSALAPVISVPVAWFFGVEKFSISRSLGVFFVVFGIALLLKFF